MSKSIINLLPDPPAGSKWWVTVLDSNTGKLGITLSRTKPYHLWGRAVINEKWTPAKVSRALSGLIEEATNG